MGKTIDKEDRLPCPICNKDEIHNPELTEPGTNIGNGQTLAKALMKEFYGKKPANSHPLSSGKRARCAQAHHLICSESMDDDEWGMICSVFGYDVNCKENGIMLPADMRVACELKIPLHKGDHSSTSTHIIGLNYVDAVKGLIDSVKKKAKRKGYCEPEEYKTLMADLNSKSKLIWQNVKSFAWTISSDGRDYVSGGIGCAGVTSIPAKQGHMCPAGRAHNLNVQPGTYFLEQ